MLFKEYNYSKKTNNSLLLNDFELIFTIMKKLKTILATFLISLSLLMLNMSEAEAKRFGGGGSFGGKSGYSSPFRRSTNAKPTRSAKQQKAYQQNQSMRQNLSKRGGLMGLLGGLALGGLLGSLLFGGAFENFNFMDILVFGGIAYLLFRLFAAKKRPAQATQGYGDNYQFRNNEQDYSSQPSQQDNSAGFDTDVLFGKNKANAAQSGFQQTDQSPDADFSPAETPTGFDESDFLAGAEVAFKRLQKAWDQRDLAEIRSLTTDKMFAEIQYQLQHSQEQNITEVLKVSSELLDIRELPQELEAVVYFDSVIRENSDQQAEQIREVWHFVKPKNSLSKTWYLDGIQQLAD